MSLFNLALAYVWQRKLVSCCTILSVALGLALMLVVLNVHRDLERNFLAQSARYELIAGASGSETALVLAGLFHADVPRGNISYRVCLDLEKQPDVLAVYPLCLGDRVGSAPVVGTTPAFLEQKSTGSGAGRYSFASGRIFQKDFEIVAGSDAARRLGLAIGQTVRSSHSHASAHEEFPYTVVGILEPTGTPDDRALYTTMASYWKIHASTAPTAPGGEVTILLLRVAKPRVFELQSLLPRRFGIMAVRPAEVMQRVFEQVLSPIERLILVYGFAVAGVAAASILTTLYLATLLRQRDLAILRSLGALPREIFVVVLLEATVIVTIGAGLGVIVSQGMSVALRGPLEARYGLELGLFQFTPAEVAATGVVILLGILASIVPAAMAYRYDLASLLREVTY